MSATVNGARPALTLIPGGLTGSRSRRSSRTRTVPRERSRFTVGDLLTAHIARGGWWQIHPYENGALGLAAAMEDGWVNVFPLEWFTPYGEFDLEADGTLYAHDIGLPPALWDDANRGAGR